MPFYGRGGSYISNFIDYNKIEKLDKTEYSEKWDETACVPYIADLNGNFVCGYDNPRSLREKCNYILKCNLLGAMYWEAAGDNSDMISSKTVARLLLKKIQ